jgi:hypothetical protein
MILVKNLNGTSNNNCKCKTWLKHWENVSGKSLPASCREVSCKETTLVGAHVKKVGVNDDSNYIVPLCQSHNMTKENFYVMDESLVSANKSKTCDQ